MRKFTANNKRTYIKKRISTPKKSQKTSSPSTKHTRKTPKTPSQQSEQKKHLNHPFSHRVFTITHPNIAKKINENVKKRNKMNNYEQKKQAISIKHAQKKLAYFLQRRHYGQTQTKHPARWYP